MSEKTRWPDRSEGLLQTIISNSLDYIMLLEPSATIRFANRTVPDLTVEKVIGTRVYDYLSERDSQRARECYERVLQTHQPDWYEAEYQAETGQVSYFESRVSPVLRDGEVEFLIVNSSDVTYRELSAKALARSEDRYRASEERYKLLTANISDAIWTLDLDLRFLYVSPPIERMLGFTPEEFLRMRLEEVMDEGSYEPVLHTLSKELEQDGGPGVDPQRSRTLDFRLKKQDGSLIWSESKVSFLRDESGAVRGILGVTRDISEWRATQQALRRSEERLRQSQRLEAVGQLAGGVAHDFNNLLTVIFGNLDLLDDAIPAGDPQRSQVEEISGASRRAASLTRQLLAFARRQHLEPEVLSLNEVVSDLGRILKRLIPEHVRIVTDLDPGLGHVEADRGQLEQVLVNLAVNARDAMPRGGELRIATANADLQEGFDAYDPPVVPDRYVKLTVADDGPGIAEELQPRIFEPFFTTKGPGEGTGMGLATVYGIVKQSRGYVWVASEPGRGTTFEILLPRCGKPKTERQEMKDGSETDGGGSETVLVVEDDATVRALAKSVLGGAGYRVLEAAGGRAAIEICAGEGGRIDLIVTDMVMPEMSGDEMARRLLEAFPKIEFLFMSGYGDAVHRARWKRVGKWFLEKPFNAERLLAKVREVLEATRSTSRSGP